MFASKKAQEAVGISFRTLISAILVIEIIVGIGGFVYALKSGDIFDRHFLSRDIALLMDTLSIPSGNVIIDYSRDTIGSAIEIQKEKVSIFNPSKFEPRKDSYEFTEDKNIEYEYKEMIPSEGKSIAPRFVKDGNRIKIFSDEVAGGEGGKLQCDIPETKESLKSKNALLNILVEHESISDLEDGKLKDKIKGADVSVLMIQPENSEQDSNPITAYVHLYSKKSDESIYFACLLMNSIYSNQEIKKKLSEKQISDFTLNRILLTDKYDSLDTDSITVVLEIGNRWNYNAYFTSQEFTEKIKELTNIAVDEYG